MSGRNIELINRSPICNIQLFESELITRNQTQQVERRRKSKIDCDVGSDIICEDFFDEQEVHVCRFNTQKNKSK